MIQYSEIQIGPLALAWIGFSILVAFAGTNKKGGFIKALLLSLLLSPIVGLFVTLSAAQKNPRGCPHCGNAENEAEYCGVCGLNHLGEKEEL